MKSSRTPREDNAEEPKYGYLRKAFSKFVTDSVWNKGRYIPNYDPNTWRYDIWQTMKYGDYGNTNSDYGWEVDHIFPVSKGGSHNLSNLQPLQWDNNRRKGDLYPWSC